jgi:hypothetical protein
MPQWITDLWEFASSVHFTDWKVGCALAVVALLLVWLWKGLQHAVAHTAVHKHKARSFALFGLICSLLLVGSWSMFAMAQADPKSTEIVSTESYMAREFILMEDRSGSMFSWDIEAPELAPLVDRWEKEQLEAYEAERRQYPLLYPNPPRELVKRPERTSAAMIQRFQAALYVAEKFLKSRPDDDRFAMFTFDDSCYMVEPLGRDRKLLLEALREISRKSGGGTNFDGPHPGSPQVGAVQKSIDHLNRYGKAKVRCMILISDGDAGISPERHQQLVEQMKKPGQEIHIYALVAGPKANMTNSVTESLRRLVKEVNPNDPNRPELAKTVIWAGDGKAMEEAFELINRLETSSVESNPVPKDRDVRHEFILAGCVLLALFMGACSVFREEF